MIRSIPLFGIPLLPLIWGTYWCSGFPSESALPPIEVVRWVSVEELPRELMLHPSVFWEPRDTTSLRKLLRESPLVEGKSVLEIGTGSGLLALCCWQAGADRVVATDINPHAITCARANAARHQADIDFRLVPSDPASDTGAFAVIGEDERFDLVISNPPWENEVPRKWSEYALYDTNFQLLRSLLDGLPLHLTPGGRGLLAYGCVEAIAVTRRLAAERDLELVILDSRDPDSLPNLFLPGMALGVTRAKFPPPSRRNAD